MEKDTQQSLKKRGRKSTGRKKRDFYITEEEMEQLRIYLQDIRRGESPIRYPDIKAKADEEYTAAIERQAKGLYKAKQTISFYKAQSLFNLLGITCEPKPFKTEVQRKKGEIERERTGKRKELSIEEYNTWADKKAEEQRQSWERLKQRWGID